MGLSENIPPDGRRGLTDALIRWQFVMQSGKTDVSITSIPPDETVPARYPCTRQSLRPHGELARPRKPRAPYKPSGSDARRGTPESHRPDRETNLPITVKPNIIQTPDVILGGCRTL